MGGDPRAVDHHVYAAVALDDGLYQLPDRGRVGDVYLDELGLDLFGRRLAGLFFQFRHDHLGSSGL